MHKGLGVFIDLKITKINVYRKDFAKFKVFQIIFLFSKNPVKEIISTTQYLLSEYCFLSQQFS